jgi:hypothetical protein
LTSIDAKARSRTLWWPVDLRSNIRRLRKCLTICTAPGVIAHDVWAGNPLPGPNLDFAGSLMLAEKAEHAYEDAHCWVLTPDSFLALMRSLTDSHMTNFQLVDLHPTAPNMLDFSVVLRK